MDVLDVIRRTPLEFVGEGERVLEVGCGPGLVLEQLRTRKPSLLVAVDVEDFSRQARAAGAHFVRASLEHLPFKPGAFDTAVCVSVYNGIPYRTAKRGLGEMAAVARKRVVVTSQNARNPMLRVNVTRWKMYYGMTLPIVFDRVFFERELRRLGARLEAVRPLTFEPFFRSKIPVWRWFRRVLAGLYYRAFASRPACAPVQVFVYRPPGC